MLERAESSVAIMTTKEGLARKAKRYKSLLKKLSERGIKIKIAAPMTEEMRSNLEIKTYTQMKSVKNIDARFVIIDDKEMLFTISDDKDTQESYDTAVWVNTPFFTKAMTKMFNNVWQDA